MTLIHALILGIVEGITEFLPISSTAHLEISARILHLAQSDFLKSFEIIIQFGAILAVIVIYFRLLAKNKEIWKRIIVAFIPTGVIGFILYKIIKKYLLGNFGALTWALLIGGVVIILFEYFYKNKDTEIEDSTKELETLSYKKAFLIGCVQSLAVIPGVSRSATTIIFGRALGIGKIAIVEFSFLLAIPTIAAAAAYDFLKSAPAFSGSEVGLLGVGFIAAFISALISIKFLLRFIKNRTFVSFGIYRVVLALCLLFFF